MKKFLVALAAALISLPVLADVTGIVSPPGGSGSSLPSQTGNSGKYLTTDGTSPSWASPTASASSITPGTTTVVGSTAPCLIDNSATTVMGCLAETGTGSAVLATSPTLVTPNLGTPSAINLTNASALPCSATPALTGDVTTTAGSCGTTVSKVSGAGSPTNGQFFGYTTGGGQGWYTPSSSATTITPGTTTVSGATAPCFIENSTGTTMGCASPLTAIGVLNSATPVNETASYTPTDTSNANGEYTMSCTAACTFTIPPNSSVAYAVGAVLTISQLTASIATLTPGAGVTFQSTTYGASTSQTYALAQYGFIQIQQTATNTWQVVNWDAPVAQGQGTYALSGTCTTSAHNGNAKVGTITLSSAGSCTLILTFSGIQPALTGWVGTMYDQTQAAVPAWMQSSSSTTSITFTVPAAAASADVLTFGVIGSY